MIIEPEQRTRFGPLRASPPAPVIDRLRGASPGTGWTATRLGHEGGYPNGGMWRVHADQSSHAGPSSAVVKRTGATHLGTSTVWRGRADPGDPQWWGREAEFYRSALATSGWTGGVRTARCHVDDHDDVRDLWLEEITDVPAPLGLCERAVAGLARWQVAHASADQAWLSAGWIARHVDRHELDNARTLAHPAWSAAIAQGLDPVLRDVVAHRVTDPERITQLLSGCPQLLTHHDCHDANLGRVDDDVVIIDWAYVGWGPVGHDAGHLALTLESAGALDPTVAWSTLESAYCRGLTAAGWPGDLADVRRSMALSNQLRLGWLIDHVLDHADQVDDQDLAAHSRLLLFIAGLA